MSGNWDQYEWIVVVGAMLAFFTAFGIGANGIANAFATSVGAKSITLRKAVILAGTVQFFGVVLAGASVTDTVRRNVARTEPFEDDPEVLMYGMMCVLAATGLWLLLASYLELPVSTTHSTIGGIIGMALTAHGSEAVVWYEFDDSKEALRKYKGVAQISVSWVMSPVLSGVLAVFLFWFVRTFILRHVDSRQRSFIVLPILVGATVALNVYFIVYHGLKRKIGKDRKVLSDILGAGWSTLIALGLGSIVGISVWFFYIPRLRERVIKKLREQEDENASCVAHNIDAQTLAGAATTGVMGAVERPTDVHSVIATDKQVHDIYESSESFDPGTEESFKHLQVLVAGVGSFAYGANDVAGAMGPFAGIWDIYRNRGFSGSKSNVPGWILVIAGTGAAVGMATYGYNIMRAIGVKLVKMSASRGFAIELGAATVIVIGSRNGIPLSSTHCQVGATVGVGLLEGRKGVNLLLLMKIIVGWIITMVVVGGTTAAFFAQGVYAPSIPNLGAINRFTNGLDDTLDNMTSLLNDLGQNETATEFQDRYAETLEFAMDQSEVQTEIVDMAFTAVAEECRALQS